MEEELWVSEWRERKDWNVKACWAWNGREGEGEDGEGEQEPEGEV